MIGIVILNYRTFDMTIKCVQSILEKTEQDFKIYIVDNFSEDGSYNNFCYYFSNNVKICVLGSDVNGGYSKGNNIGICKAIEDGADCITIINSDVILLNNAIDIMYKNLLIAEDFCLVGPSIMSLDGKEQQFARRKLDLKGYVFDKKPFYWLRKYISFFSQGRIIPWQKQNSVFSFFGMVSGCCFLVKSDFFSKIGYFDENVFLFGEEDILAYKLEKERKKVAIASNASVLHAESSSIGKKGLAFNRFHRSMSALYILRAYAKLSNFAMLLPILISIVPLLMSSFFNPSYRKLLISIPQQLNTVFKNFPEKD